MRKALVAILVGVGLLCTQAVIASEAVQFEPFHVAECKYKKSHSTKKHHSNKHKHKHARKHAHSDEFDRKKHHYKHHTSDYSGTPLPRSKRVLEHIEEDLPMNELAPEHR